LSRNWSLDQGKTRHITSVLLMAVTVTIKERQTRGDMMPPIRLLLFSEFHHAESSLRAAIRSDPELILMARAASLSAMLAAYAACLPDVVVSYSTPIDRLQTVRRHFPAVKVLVCGPSGAEARNVLRAGAVGFLLCASAPVEMVGAVRSIHAGNVAVSLELTRQLLG
jgi:DNA-binding NarL/FixJ family response regulator